jgi:FMN-dependent NADH-azoreductase
MSLIRIDASIRLEGSVSRAVADTVEAAWRAEKPDATIVRRDLGTEPLPGDAWRSIITAAKGPQEQSAAQVLAASLVDQMESAEGYLFAVPLYNYGVPHHFKNWVDLLIADPRMGPGQQPLAGRPAVLVTVRGGAYGPGTPREGWDHNTPYLRRILADLWGLELKVVEAELTLAEVTPGMESLRPLAATSLVKAQEAANAGGKFLAERTSDK